MDISFEKIRSQEEWPIVTGFFRGEQALHDLRQTPEASAMPWLDLLEDHMKSTRFTGEIGDCAVVSLASRDFPGKRIHVLGLGERQRAGDVTARRIGGQAVAGLVRQREHAATIMIPRPAEIAVSDAEWAANLAFGAALRNYRFAKWKTVENGGGPALLQRAAFVTAETAKARRAFERLETLARAVHLARDLTNEPPNVLFPASFANLATELCESSGIAAKVLDERQLRDNRLEGILAVGDGSVNKPRLLILEWRGDASRNATDVALVGKGVTFDSGGLTLKPLEEMRLMKIDMSAGAAVLGAVQAMANQRLRCNVAGVIPLAENMPSGSAYRPSDVLRMACGITVEVANTDAEGRIMLLDAIWYAATNYVPDTLISMATISDSNIEALGKHYGAVYSEDDELASLLSAAGTASDEPLWRLPAGSRYDDDMKSEIADVLSMLPARLGADGSYVFRLLRHAVGARSRFAHIEMSYLDIAEKDGPACPRGATGYGVRLFEEAVRRLSADTGS